MFFWPRRYCPSSYRAQGALPLTSFAELEPLCRPQADAMKPSLCSTALNKKINISRLVLRDPSHSRANQSKMGFGVGNGLGFTIGLGLEGSWLPRDGNGCEPPSSLGEGEREL